MNLRFHRGRTLALTLLATLLLTLRGAWAYHDVKYGFSVTGPTGWRPLRQGKVPGIYRFGWISDKAAKDHSGANLMVFVILLEKAHTSKELLDANVASAKAHGLKVVHTEEHAIGGKPGFIMEVEGTGNGLMLIPGPAPTKADPRLRLAPTRQRWFAAVDGTRVVGLMSTCTTTGLSSHRAELARAEASLSFP